MPARDRPHPSDPRPHGPYRPSADRRLDYGGAFRTKANRLPEPVRDVVNAFPRQALHAFLLVFEHPSTGETLRFEAPLPADMEALRAKPDKPLKAAPRRGCDITVMTLHLEPGFCHN
jgi:hypothetical protein